MLAHCASKGSNENSTVQSRQRRDSQLHAASLDVSAASTAPHGHEVVLIDGNAQPMDEESIARYVREQNIGLVGIGAMTRMIAKAYRMADAVRAAGVKVVMGGPHVTEMADEALGRDGGPRHADAVALGEADETWPRIVEDAARGTLKDVYAPVDDFGQERKPQLQSYPEIPWDKIKLDQFNLLPGILHPLLKRVGAGWGTFRIIPMESGRGCPYGCEFCTVTGFFGDSIRFRANESVVNELLLLKARAREEGGQIAVYHHSIRQSGRPLDSSAARLFSSIFVLRGRLHHIGRDRQLQSLRLLVSRRRLPGLSQGWCLARRLLRYV